MWLWMRKLNWCATHSGVKSFFSMKLSLWNCPWNCRRNCPLNCQIQFNLLWTICGTTFVDSFRDNFCDSFRGNFGNNFRDSFMDNIGEKRQFRRQCQDNFCNICQQLFDNSRKKIYTPAFSRDIHSYKEKFLLQTWKTSST